MLGAFGRTTLLESLAGPTKAEAKSELTKRLPVVGYSLPVVNALRLVEATADSHKTVQGNGVLPTTDADLPSQNLPEPSSEPPTPTTIKRVPLVSAAISPGVVGRVRNSSFFQASHRGSLYCEREISCGRRSLH